MADGSNSRFTKATKAGGLLMSRLAMVERKGSIQSSG